MFIASDMRLIAPQTSAAFGALFSPRQMVAGHDFFIAAIA